MEATLSEKTELTPTFSIKSLLTDFCSKKNQLPNFSQFNRKFSLKAICLVVDWLTRTITGTIA